MPPVLVVEVTVYLITKGASMARKKNVADTHAPKGPFLEGAVSRSLIGGVVGSTILTMLWAKQKHLAECRGAFVATCDLSGWSILLLPPPLRGPSPLKEGG